MRISGLAIAISLSVVTSLTGMAWAQERIETTSAEPELLAQRVVGPLQDLRGVRIVRPGALLFASFDTDGSLSVSVQEIRDNAGKAFKRADVNNNGTLSIFEQQDWAREIGSHDGQLANAVSFDTNIDRMVTKEEFASGLERIAKAYIVDETGEIPFSNLVLKPNGEEQHRSDQDDIAGLDRDLEERLPQ